MVLWPPGGGTRCGGWCGDNGRGERGEGYEGSTRRAQSWPRTDVWLRVEAGRSARVALVSAASSGLVDIRVRSTRLWRKRRGG
jgi:hypothetical protein